MRPLAIIPAYNEADILPAVLRHLERQGCDIYVLDNWSTDLSPDLLAHLGQNIERWPSERPTLYEWSDILTHIEEIALERGRGRWVIFHDADEIRRVPGDWGTLTIEQALETVTVLGYNAVQFKVLTFVPTDNVWTAGENPERHFRYHRNDHVDHGIPHVKAWFQGDERVDLHTNGGHQVLFSNRYVCPHPFILKHYPIRSQEHGERKVLKERFPRYPPKERSKLWHVQYDEYVNKPAPTFIYNPSDLIKDKNNITIVTFLRSTDTFHRLADSIERHDSSYRRVVIAPGSATFSRLGWEIVRAGEPGAVADNLNAGIAACGTDDILYVRDDIEFLGPVVEELSDVLYLTSAAMASAQVVGANGAPNMADRVDSRWKETRRHPPFGCVLMRRAALDAVGPLKDQASDLVRAEAELSGRARAHGLPVVMCRCRVKQREPDVNSSSVSRPPSGIEALALASRN
jgi:glycosyltransferase involved in cell wall biosynthesis